MKDRFDYCRKLFTDKYGNTKSCINFFGTSGCMLKNTPEYCKEIDSQDTATVGCTNEN